jgi:hypothetical protein
MPLIDPRCVSVDITVGFFLFGVLIGGIVGYLLREFSEKPD